MTELNKKLVLIELNEINFDIVKKYIVTNSERLPSLAKLFKLKHVRTASENQYDELEPWIQWASVHTTKKFAEHGIYRLGDIVGNKSFQIFELLEKAGFNVGVVSAMNAENRLKKPSYFIPDPWTKTKTDGSWWSRSLHQAISQTVNENSQARISFHSALILILAFLRFSQMCHMISYIKLIANCRRKPWLKALFLDLMLHDIHCRLYNKKSPNFSTLFLNAGAHIQHHYFFNAKPLRNQLVLKNPEWYVGVNEDPLADVLGLYDLIVGEYFSNPDFEVILATGLSQKPYDKLKFYYRLNSHSKFLNDLGINFSNVYPRMTRDFLIEFDTEHQATLAQAILTDIKIHGTNISLFGEIDNRGQSLFVTLTYPHEITHLTRFISNAKTTLLKPLVSFVAIKNGMHQEEGFAFFTSGVAHYAPEDKAHVAFLGKAVLNYFEINSI
jgi:hypothetical protein